MPGVADAVNSGERGEAVGPGGAQKSRGVSGTGQGESRSNFAHVEPRSAAQAFDARQGPSPPLHRSRRMPRSNARPRRRFVWTVVTASLMLMAVVVTTAVNAQAAVVASPSHVPSLQLTLGPPVNEPTDFWGMDLIADKNPGPDPATLLAATPARVLSYPVANVTETMNLTSGVVYHEGGTTKAVVPISQFISICAAISCHAIIGLPMEINSTSTDAYEAHYIVDVLKFHPEYFVYGNEPAHWSCFGISWVQLAEGTPCNTGNITIPAFANETAAAIQAVNTALDGQNVPAAMCLGGTGKQGPVNETNWILGLEANPYDSENCAAYAMHVKDAHSQTTVPTLANFYATLTGPQSLVADYQNVSPITDGKPLYMTEVGAFTPKSVFTPVFRGTWAQDVLDSAMVVQSMQNVLPDMAWWAWALGGKDAVYDGQTTTLYAIWATLFTKLGPVWQSSEYHGQSGVFAEAAWTGTEWSILLVNTNITESFHFGLHETGLPLVGSGTLYTWTSTGDVVQSEHPLRNGFTAPPQSVVMLVA